MTTYLAQANTGADSLASTKTVTKPAPVGAGAVGVFWLVRWHESGSFPAVTPPAGAVLRGTITTTSMQTQCYLHRVNAETSFTYTWTSGRWSTLAAVWFSGVDPTADLATVPFQSATGSGTAIGTLTVTSNIDSALAWHVNTIDTSGVTHTPPTGFTEVADVSPSASAYRITVTSGSQDATGATASPTTNWAAGLVALPPAPTGGATGDAALFGTVGLSAAGTRSRSGGAALAGTAGLAAVGVRAASGSAGLAATAVLDADGQTTVTGQAALDAHADLTATPRRDTGGSTSLTGVAELAASALIDHPGQSTLTATADLEAGGLRATTATAGLAGTAALTAGGVLGSPPVTGSGVLNATAVLAAAGHRTTTATTVLHATAALTATGTAAGTGSAGLAATAVLTASGTTSGSGDDIEVTVGAPYSPWTAGPPQASVWAAGVPEPSSWEVGAPW